MHNDLHPLHLQPANRVIRGIIIVKIITIVITHHHRRGHIVVPLRHVTPLRYNARCSVLNPITGELQHRAGLWDTARRWVTMNHLHLIRLAITLIETIVEIIAAGVATSSGAIADRVNG
jgi:hypothetical protein